MFEGILKAFKKRLETSLEEQKPKESPSTPNAEEGELAEFDILSYVEQHGVVDKDRAKPKKVQHKQAPFKKKLKKKKEESVASNTEELFAEKSQLDDLSHGENEILEHVNRFGVYNKDGSASKRSEKKSDRSVYKNKRAMEKRIDLHGMTVDEAEHYLRRVIDDAKAVGITQLLIVHGRGMHSIGNGGVDVLRQRVRQLLSREYSHLVESYKYASGAEGGDGATRVFLK